MVVTVHFLRHRTLPPIHLTGKHVLYKLDELYENRGVMVVVQGLHEVGDVHEVASEVREHLVILFYHS